MRLQPLGVFAPAFVAVSVLAGCAAADSTQKAAQFQKSADCDVGLYRRGAEFLALTRLPRGYRFTFQDGRTGKTTDENPAAFCGDGAVLVNGKDVWSKAPLRITDTRFKSGEIELAGELIEPPDANADTPLIIYAHGSERYGWIGASRDPFIMAGYGVSVFVYDKRGTGGSEGVYSQNFPELADDLVAASEEAKKLAAGRFGRFGLYGVSQGGWIAPLAADRAGAEFIGIGFGLVVDVKEEDAEQVFKEMRELGYGEDDIEKAREVTDATAKIMSSSYRKGFDELAAAGARYADEPWLSQIKGEYTGTVLSMSEEDLRRNGIPEVDELRLDWTLDPMEVLRSVDAPMLWVLAQEDREAPIALTRERLGALRNAGKDITIAVFPKTGHGMWEFEQAPDGSRNGTRITDGYYKLMSDWAKGKLGDSYGASRFE